MQDDAGYVCAMTDESWFQLGQDKDYASLPEVTKAFGSKELHPSAFKPAAQDENRALAGLLGAWHHDHDYDQAQWEVNTTDMIQGYQRQLCFHQPIGDKAMASCIDPFSIIFCTEILRQERVKSALAPLVQLPKEANFKLPD